MQKSEDSNMAADHNALIQQEFTRQAQAYATAPSLTDPVRVERLARAIAPSPNARALEVACGPGHVSLVLAGFVGEMTGVDITDAALAIAEQRRQERGIANLRFQTGDAMALPFPDGAFDLVVCRYAFHHFEQPPLALAEMRRMCRADGVVAVEDLIVSEFPDRAAVQNEYENLRDPSHTSAYPLSALLGLFTSARLEVQHVSTDALTPEVESWLERAQTPPERAAAARALIERDEREDLSGTRPFRVDGRLHFTQRTAIVVGRVLG